MTREEAIRRIKAWNLDSDDMEVLAVIIPELAESEDERIRKFICSIIDNLEPKDFVGVKKMNVLAWLEKQKEQKPQDQCVDVIKMSASLAADRLASAEMTGRLRAYEPVFKEYLAEHGTL